MKLPNSESAHIAKEKVDGYLLSAKHPIGAAKSRWFNQIGYSLDNSELLRENLRGFAKHDVNHKETNEYGTKYVIIGDLKGPTGESRLLATVWIILNDDSVPRLVTAYPGE